MKERNMIATVGSFATAAMALLLIFCVLAMPATVMAGGLTLEQLAQLRYVYEIAISPDGGTFAFTLTVQRNPFEEKNGSAWKELHVVDKNGNTRPFVTGKVRISDVAFTPDGKYISYLAERGEDTVSALYVIPVDGGESRRITKNCTDIDTYTWASRQSQACLSRRGLASYRYCRPQKEGVRPGSVRRGGPRC